MLKFRDEEETARLWGKMNSAHISRVIEAGMIGNVLNGTILRSTLISNGLVASSSRMTIRSLICFRHSAYLR